MYFKRIKIPLAMLLVCVSAKINAVDESLAEYHLSAVPNKCIALRKGRTCFAKILLSWEAKKASNYCIRRVNDQYLLNCWKFKRSGHYEYEFESEKLEKFELINKSNGNVLAHTKVLIRWVYKSKQKRGQWRLF